MSTLISSALMGCAALFATSATLAAQGPERIQVESFVSLPEDVRHPEGLASDPATGHIYVGTFDARLPESTRRNVLLRYSAEGQLLGRKNLGLTPITGLAFAEGHLYFLNFGTAKLQRVAAEFDDATPVQDIAQFAKLSPTAPAPRRIMNPDNSKDVVTFGSAGVPAPNGMVFDHQNNLYISDSFQGAILLIEKATTCSPPCKVQVVSRDPLLATAGSLPFGANGLATDEHDRTLYILNAGDGRLLRMPLPNGSISVVAESLPGADGLTFHEGRLWLTANQIDRVLGLNQEGRTLYVAGEFAGIDADGTPKGLLFPASVAVQGSWMIVTNLALPLTANAGDEWEEQVTRWNLVRFKLPAENRTP